MILSEIISPNTMVARSVNLERDLGNEHTLGQYILTDKGLEIVRRLVSGLNGGKISAWSLTGPYGMGKSCFANFLLSLCGRQNDKETILARIMLAKKDRPLFETYLDALSAHKIKSDGFFRVPVTSAFQPVNLSLAKGLQRSLKNSGMLDSTVAKKLYGKVTDLLEKDRTDAHQLLEIFREAGRRAAAPTAIVIDEFGKNLEFMARYPGEATFIFCN